MSPSRVRVLLAAALSCASGCGDGDALSDSGVPVDAALPSGVMRSPDRMGYCCARSEIQGCSGSFDPGGFATDPSMCRNNVTDIQANETTPLRTDAHGCMYWDWDFSHVRLCALLPMDAGPARRDAGTSDAGAPDGASMDAGETLDAAPADAPSTDASRDSPG